MRLGGPIYLHSDDPEELAAEHRRLGYGAAYCPKLSLDEPQRIRAVEEAFGRAGVVIAEVGAWNNMLDSDDDRRRANMEYVCDRLALADEVGALCCVNIAGSRHPTLWYGPHPDNVSADVFALIVENVRYLLDTVKPRRTSFALEMMPYNLPDSPDSYLEFLAAVDRPTFKVHLDPVNLVNSPRRYYDAAGLLRECFEKLGPHIVSCHAKDVLMRDAPLVEIEEVRPGLGTLPYGVFLSELARLPGDVPLMMEHLESAEEYDLAAAHIRGAASEAGVEFA
ncbi:MAG: sugar phosphate isomerase/epimerase [Chloroflexota bacterium]|nr:sugar phosphate isomerase/epimerase [Chloroflexota bacterium]